MYMKFIKTLIRIAEMLKISKYSMLEQQHYNNS